MPHMSTHWKSASLLNMGGSPLCAFDLGCFLPVIPYNAILKPHALYPWRQNYHSLSGAAGALCPEPWARGPVVAGPMKATSDLLTAGRPRFDFHHLAESAVQQDAPPTTDVASHKYSWRYDALMYGGLVPPLPEPVVTTQQLECNTGVPYKQCDYPDTETKPKKRYVCRFCHRRFSKSYNLLIHVRTHTDERPYSCDVCNKAFRRRDHLRDHKYIHLKDKPFTCDACGKGFCQARTLAVHRAVHSQNAPHKCAECGRGFNQRSNLKTHLLTHSDARPFTCTTCKKDFRRKCDLRRHELTHSFTCDMDQSEHFSNVPREPDNNIVA